MKKLVNVITKEVVYTGTTDEDCMEFIRVNLHTVPLGKYAIIEENSPLISAKKGVDVIQRYGGEKGTINTFNPAGKISAGEIGDFIPTLLG